MKKRIKIGFILILFLTICLMTTISNASSNLTLKKLEYDVQLNEDGTANVIETWNIRIKDTNTLFKTFEIDTSKYSEIVNVTVQEIQSDGRTKQFKQINQEQYHVDKDCFYALPISKRKFEIAWGVSAKNVTKTYKISYQIKDAIKNYSDCSEFYWQFISTESEIPADVVRATINLPNSIIQGKEIKAWAHGPLNGNITVGDRNVVLEINDLAANTMIETRIVTDTSVFPINNNKSNIAKLDTILNQEKQWAEEANLKRKQLEDRQIRIEQLRKVLRIIGIGICILLIFKIIKYHKFLKQIPKRKPEVKHPYFRDFPDENASPAEAAFLYYNKQIGMYQSQILSATLLNLCLKGYLVFDLLENGKRKKEDIKITLTQNSKKELLKDEKLVYELLEKVADSQTHEFFMKDFEKYARKNVSQMTKLWSEIEKETKEIQIQKENCSKEEKENVTKWSKKVALYFSLMVFAFIMIPFTVLPMIFLCITVIYVSIILSRYHQFTQKGVNQREEWKGLMRYMSDFSSMKDKEVPELVLWEKYLVYATAFGIADLVLKQLKIVYPQITDEEFLRTNHYTYMYLMYHGGNTSFLNTLNTSMTNTNYSSTTGGSGGFSGGGGFGGGGGGMGGR